MKVLAILGLLLILGVNPTYGEEKSCDDMILATSSAVKKHFEALKVYKKVNDRTEIYRKGMKKASNNDVTGLKRALMVSEMAMSNLPREMLPDVEDRVVLEIGKLLVKDIEDTSSEIVLLCSGRMRFPSGVRHFMFSITKDEEGDRYWTAWLY